MNYYNENDPKAAAWLRELIKGGHIAAGEVDERSIRDVRGGDLAGFCQCHFFAGIGGWSLALRLAGWPDSEAVWTGSCPCQPFSSAGKAQGLCDERHLWPAFRGLIAECHPAIVFGEQVAGADGRAWLAGVRSDLEGDGYAVGAADLCAAGVGAPHLRQRLYWVAYAEDSKRRSEYEINGEPHGRNGPGGRGESGGVADVQQQGFQIRQTNEKRSDKIAAAESHSYAGGVAHPGCDAGCATGPDALQERDCGAGQSGAWSDFQLIPCRDGKSRRIESGAFPLAHGFPASFRRMSAEVQRLAEMAGLSKQSLKRAKGFRVESLRGYGNAIVPQVAAEFITASYEAMQLDEAWRDAKLNRRDACSTPVV